MAYRLIATDIDGTLLNERREATPRTLRTLQALERQGVTVVLSTARPPRGVTALWEELRLSAPVIAYNGALIFHPGTGQVLMHHAIPKPVALEVVAAIRAVDPTINLGLELADEWHVDCIDDRLRHRLATEWRIDPPQEGDVARAIAATDRGVSKIYFVSSPEVRTAVQDRLAQTGLDSAIHVTSSGAGFVEIIAAEANKGTALRALAAQLGIPRDQTVALGDEENDIPALRAAGLGIAMGNAPDAVKAAAAVVAGPNTADGWAAAVETWVLREIQQEDGARRANSIYQAECTVKGDPD